MQLEELLSVLALGLGLQRGCRSADVSAVVVEPTAAGRLTTTGTSRGLQTVLKTESASQAR